MGKREDVRLAKELLSLPGDTIQETLDELGMSQQELAERMGRHKKTINEIIKGKAPITAETAIQLERVLGIPASFWLERERLFREELQRLDMEESLEENAAWAKKFPIAEMKKRGWLPDSANTTGIAHGLLTYFGIASPRQWDTLYHQYSPSFRISLVHSSNPESITVWLRQGEIHLSDLELEEYDKSKFKQALSDVSELVYQHPRNFKDQLQEICKSCGVGLVYTECLPKAPISGAVRWFRNNPMIQLSDRYKTNDKFWFTFFHEAGHILLHGKKEIFLEESEGSKNDLTKEKEADQFAGNWLIPDHLYNQVTEYMKFDEEIVIRFSKKNKIHPGIVVGRLQHDGLLLHSQLNHLKVKIDLFQ
jgi:addiction module HigA family antidote